MKRLHYLLVTALVIAFDAVTKWLITRSFDIHGDPLVVIPRFFQIVHVRNTGAAFGIGANSASPLVPLMLNIGAIIVFVIVVVYSLRAALNDRMLQFGLHLILGGAIGNLVDRFRFGSVVDFLDFFIVLGGRERHWPSFNVADAAICVGIGLLFLDMNRKPAEKRVAASGT